MSRLLCYVLAVVLMLAAIISTALAGPYAAAFVVGPAMTLGFLMAMHGVTL